MRARSSRPWATPCTRHFGRRGRRSPRPWRLSRVSGTRRGTKSGLSECGWAFTLARSSGSARTISGPPLRCGRLANAAHGGQVLLSSATAELVREALADGVGLRDLGEHRLKDLRRPERIFQLVAPGMAEDFPA